MKNNLIGIFTLLLFNINANSFKMNFNDGLLTSFEISGSQKMIFTNATEFKINCVIN